MKTDISLESEAKKIIIDCKFYKETLVKNYEKEMINPNHLYQITAYLGNTLFPDHRTLEGILLNPVVTKTVNIPFK
jgi:5-methylcytosine-specific restriction enzyme subunit McrC